MANSKAFAALRIAVGTLFLIFAEYKVTGSGFIYGGGFQYWIDQFLHDGASYPFMTPVLQHFVLPHAIVIAWLASCGELAIGLALVLGVFVRVASIFGIIYMIALLFSSNYPGAGAPFWEYFGASLNHLVLAMCFAAFAMGRPGDVWSLRSLKL
jgi:uncharacterized membrane protein YphA (DoxX/SURF4 family)